MAKTVVSPSCGGSLGREAADGQGGQHEMGHVSLAFGHPNYKVYRARIGSDDSEDDLGVLIRC